MGEIFATGRPLSVTTKVSPALTLASHRLAYRRSLDGTTRLPAIGRIGNAATAWAFRRHVLGQEAGPLEFGIHIESDLHVAMPETEESSLPPT